MEVLFLFNLFTCFNVASTCYKRAELKYPREIKKKIPQTSVFLRTIKSHEELTEYSNPLNRRHQINKKRSFNRRTIFTIPIKLHINKYIHT